MVGFSIFFARSPSWYAIARQALIDANAPPRRMCSKTYRLPAPDEGDDQDLRGYR